MIRIRNALFAAVLLCASSMALAVPDADAVNINTADAAALAAALKGVGASRAEAIVRYREQNGTFVDLYELANVKGIGERTVEMNESKIVLED